MAVHGRIADGSFGVHFPDLCDDAPNPPTGTNAVGFSLALRAEVPPVEWPLNVTRIPEPTTIMDLIEFCNPHVALPTRTGRYHDFFSHYHLLFDEAQGREFLRSDINGIFSPSIAYGLRGNGQIVRLAPTGLRESLIAALSTRVIRRWTDFWNLRGRKSCAATLDGAYTRLAGLDQDAVRRARRVRALMHVRWLGVHLSLLVPRRFAAKQFAAPHFDVAAHLEAQVRHFWRAWRARDELIDTRIEA